MMKEHRFFIAARADAANNEFHVLIVDWTLQGDPLSRSEAVQYLKFLTDHCSLPVSNKCLPFRVRHFYLGIDLLQLWCIDSEVGKEIPFVLVDSTEPREGHHRFDTRHCLYLLKMADRQYECE